MNTTPPTPATPSPNAATAASTRAPVPTPLDGQDPLALAAYNQNFETFRALNALMWQIPLIAMTLTGGLWFGVSKIDGMPLMRSGLLLLAVVGDIGLIVILERLRQIIGEYLAWLEGAYARGFVAAVGTTALTKGKTVKLAFQLMLGFAAFISIVLFVASMVQLLSPTQQPDPRAAAIAWYDTHAAMLADGYEGLDAEQTHPRLFAMLKSGPRLRVLDVGAGTGRDAAALAALGHEVTAVEPSAKMLRLARTLHADRDIAWVPDGLPDLSREKGPYDLIMLSAVWMHVPPEDRSKAFDRLVALLAPQGGLYLTLRLGPADPERALWSVDADEVRSLAAANRLKVEDLGNRPDLLGRDQVRWQTLMISRAAG